MPAAIWRIDRSARSTGQVRMLVHAWAVGQRELCNRDPWLRQDLAHSARDPLRLRLPSLNALFLLLEEGGARLKARAPALFTARAGCLVCGFGRRAVPPVAATWTRRHIPCYLRWSWSHRRATAGFDRSDDYRPIVEAAGKLRCRSAMIDGEIAALDEEGRSDFHAQHLKQTATPTFQVRTERRRPGRPAPRPPSAITVLIDRSIAADVA
jgi:hypothetical protein